MNMTPEDFDLDFDFDKEYGYRTDPHKNTKDADDFDLDAALARELGPDFDARFEEEYAASQAALKEELAAASASAAGESSREDMENTRFFTGFSQLDDADEEDEEDDVREMPEDDIDAIFAASSASIAAATADVVTAKPADDVEEPADDEQPEADDIPVMRRPVRRPRPKGVDLSAITEKVDLQGVKDFFAGAGVVIADNTRAFAAALKECKPGKMDKKQMRRFKNDVLPILIGAAAFLMCLIFIAGSIGRSYNPEDRKEAALRESIAQAEAEAAAAAEIQRILNAAAVHASGYDYQSAIDTLDSYKDAETGRELTDEMAAIRAEYAAALTDLVVWDDPTTIANLSFHVLIEDANRAYADSSLAGSYRKNFVTTAQFSAILEQLYENGFVLVNLDSCIEATTDDTGKTTYTVKPLYLPSDKTPVMITETLVNYFEYMTDGDGDGQPDAGGDGFASRLVIEGGKIKAEYIDAGGQTHVGDYDLVPILDSFIEAHPDFSYRGAKAILAVTGDEGVFGWRVNQDETQADRARDIVEILRANGYQIACNSYANLDYGATSLAEISADLSKWKQEIVPVLGEVDILVIARGGSIDAPASMESAGSRFSAVYDAGFRYIIDAGSAPAGNLTADFFYHSRVMVVGSKLGSDAYEAYFSQTE